MSTVSAEFTEENFVDLLLSYRDMFVQDTDFVTGYVTSVFSELDMYPKDDDTRKDLFSEFGSINLRVDLEKEYSSLFSVSDYDDMSGLIFRKLLSYDIALRMYDVLGSFAGGDNPFFDENDDDSLNGLINGLRWKTGNENIDVSDYKGALDFATEFITNDRTTFIEEISDQDKSTYNGGFMVDHFHKAWMAPFYSDGVFKINVLVDNIYIDDMRIVLNGIAALKLGSEVWVSLKMPRSCHDSDKDAYGLFPHNLGNHQFGIRDVALLCMGVDKLKCIYD